MLKITYISIVIILIAVMFAGCTGTVSTPTPTPMATPSGKPVATDPGIISPTADPTALVYGTVTLDGKPAEKYKVGVAFPINMGWALSDVSTGADGSYAIHMDPKQLRNMTFSRLVIYDEQGNKIYSDSETYRIDGQPLNFAFVTQSGSPSILPPSSPVSSRITPTPAVDPIRTAKAPVKTTSMTSYVEFKVYDNMVTVDYYSGQGKLYVDSFGMGGEYGADSGYLREPGDNITLAFNLTMPRELPEHDAVIEVYQPTADGVPQGGVKYYPRTGDMKTIN